jgi:hypothetical protein
MLVSLTTIDKDKGFIRASELQKFDSNAEHKIMKDLFAIEKTAE